MVMHMKVIANLLADSVKEGFPPQTYQGLQCIVGEFGKMLEQLVRRQTKREEATHDHRGCHGSCGIISLQFYNSSSKMVTHMEASADSVKDDFHEQTY
jgi:hypothetical protein